MSGSEDIFNIRKNTNTRTQVRNLIKEFNLSRTLSVPTETLDYFRQQIALDGLVEVSDDNSSFIGKNYIRRGYYLTFEPDYQKLQLWLKLNAPFSIAIDSSLHERNGTMYGIPLPIRGPDNGLEGSVNLATGFDGLDDYVDIPHDPVIEMSKVLEGFSFHIKYAPCGIDLSNGQPITLYAKKDPVDVHGHENAIISVIMPDGSVNTKLTFEGVEYTQVAPQYHNPDTTEFGINTWYDHTVVFNRIDHTLELLLDNQLFNSTPWENPHITPYPYIDTNWHIGRSTFTDRGLFWGGLADFRYYWDLKLSYQHNYNLFTNRITISPIARGQTASIGYSYITHSVDIGFNAGFLMPLSDGRGFRTGYFLFLSEPVTNDISVVYDVFAYPKIENDVYLIYDLEYVAPIHNTIQVVYNLGPPSAGPPFNDLLIQYRVAAQGGNQLPVFNWGAVADLNGSSTPSAIFTSMRNKNVQQALIVGDVTHTADANDELAAINLLDGPPAPPSGGQAFKFNIGGDFRSGEDAEDTAANLVSDTPNVIFMLGDYAVGDASEDEWCNTIMAPVKNSNIPVWGCMGNHDNDDYLTTGFFENTSWVWSVKYGNIMFISCDTVEESVDATRYLVEAAQANPAIMRIVILMHESVFKQAGGGTDGADATIEYHNMFKQHSKLKLVIAGHSHNWTVFPPYEGITYVICEDGGQQPDEDTGCMHCTSDANGTITCNMIPNGGQSIGSFTIPATGTQGAVTIGANSNSQLPQYGVAVRPKRAPSESIKRNPILKLAAGSYALWSCGEYDDANGTVLSQIKTYFGISGDILYKAKRMSNIYYIMLNSEDANFATAGNAQYTWCQARLAEALALKGSGQVAWIVVALHKPFYNAHNPTQPVNTPGGIAFWQPLFDQYQVDFVLHGHDHALEVSKPLKTGGTILGNQGSGGVWDFSQQHGQIYMLVGGGGAASSVGSFTTPSTWMWGTGSSFGYALFSVDSTGLNMTVQLYNQTASQLLYQFSVTKVGAAPPTCQTGYHWDSQLQQCVQDSTNPPPPSQPVLKIAVCSDGDAGGTMDDVVSEIVSKNVHQLIVCGDFTHDSAGGSIDAFSPFSSSLITGAIWTPGNHESPNEDGSSSVMNEVANFFNVSTSSYQKSKQIQNVYIIGLYTVQSNFDSNGSPSHQWVQAELSKAAALKSSGQVDWIILAGHKPFYANAGAHHPPSEDDMANAADLYQPLFNQYQVDFVFNGHNHDFNVSEPLTLNGAEQFTLFGQAYDFTKTHGQFYICDGNMGRGNYGLSSTSSNFRYSNDSDAGFVLLNFDATGLRCNVQLISDSGSVLHQFDVVKTTATTPPPPSDGNPPPPTGGTIDSNGIKWFEATGSGGVIEQSRTADNDFRWSANSSTVRQRGYEATAYFTFDGVASGGHFAMKIWGGNHCGDCQYEEDGACCCWYDLGIRANGDVQREIERPHPSNDEFTLPPGGVQYMTNIGVPMEGNTIGLKWLINPLIAGGTADNGGIRIKMWVDTSGLLAGKPQNQWRLVFEFVDNGTVLGDYDAPDELEIEVRNSDTDNTEDYAGGVHWRAM